MTARDELAAAEAAAEGAATHLLRVALAICDAHGAELSDAEFHVLSGLRREMVKRWHLVEAAHEQVEAEERASKVAANGLAGVER